MPLAALKNDPSAYRDARKRFHVAVRNLVALSANLGGTPSHHGREYWSSILLSKMTLTSMTLDKIIPKVGSAKSTELWDLSSIAVLVRALAENYLLMFWLCIEPEDEQTWQFRITALTIADNRARYRMTAEVEGQSEPMDFVKAQRTLADKLTGNALFQQLNAGAQRDILKGNKAPFIQDDVIECLKIDRANFRSLYRYLSAFVHTGTISFFRMEQHQRGNGEFNDYDALAVIALMEFSILAVEAAIVDVKRLHKLGGASPGP